MGKPKKQTASVGIPWPPQWCIARNAYTCNKYSILWHENTGMTICINVELLKYKAFLPFRWDMNSSIRFVMVTVSVVKQQNPIMCLIGWLRWIECLWPYYIQGMRQVLIVSLNASPTIVNTELVKFTLTIRQAIVNKMWSRQKGLHIADDIWNSFPTIY